MYGLNSSGANIDSCGRPGFQLLPRRFAREACYRLDGESFCWAQIRSVAPVETRLQHRLSEPRLGWNTACSTGNISSRWRPILLYRSLSNKRYSEEGLVDLEFNVCYRWAFVVDASLNL